ncbi:quinone oxidoreductase family protein [Marinivivus vitaminiproducens]|uniref:quinone oxidoreductase family protein n=1 Tax=Marinivivus vitaminiproducens TaxID=3035935 RepID=UPI0027A3CCBA|nr:quinone oxidoreductase [Geminicoccaceae bacterium SCSIO 64248]
MAHMIQVRQTGGPERLEWVPVAVGDPGEGQVRLRQTAIGLNFIDVYYREGTYAAERPFVPGLEAAGVVEAVGPGVPDVKTGDRVAYAAPPLGAYATERLMPADRLVALPDGITDEQAAAMMLKGMTAWYLLRRTHEVRPGEPVLFHAAAGGVGLIAGQWGKALGAVMIGTVGSAAKVEQAKDAGYDHVIDLSREDLVARVRDLTGGEGVPVVYDSIGRDTFMRSLDCLRPLGLMASFGQSSGSVESFSPGLLAQKGSLFLTRPVLNTYTAKRADLVQAAADLFEVVRSGAVRIRVNQTYPLAEAARAHADLQGRRTTGQSVLLP